MSELFKQNIDALRSTGKLYFSPVDLQLTDMSSVRAAVTRRGRVYIEVIDASGQWIALNSPVDPVNEAERLFDSSVSQCDIGTVDTFVIIGFEAGYLFESVLRKCVGRCKILIWEPSADSIRIGLSSRPLDIPDHADVDVSLFLGADTRGIAASIAGTINPLSIRGLRILCNPRVAAFHRDMVEAFSTELRARTSSQRLLIGTTLRHNETFFRNFLLNIPFLNSSADIELIGSQVRGKDCILVSAGPSLEKHLDELRQVQGSLPILCVGPAWKTLRAASIRPDLVFSIDPFPDNFTHFDGLQSEGEVLVSDLSNNHDVVKSFQGAICFFHTNIEKGQFAKQLGFATRFLSCGGSVAHTAFDFCTQYSVRTLILIGQDLAYTGGVSHARGHTGRTTLESDFEKHPDRFVSVTGYGGVGQVQTNLQMDAYRLWFENQPMLERVINATEGGARILGIREMAFRDALNCSEQSKFQLQPICSSQSHHNVDKLKRAYASMKRDLLRLKDHFSEAHRIMLQLSEATDPKLVTMLEGKYNSLAKKLPKHSTLSERLLEEFSVDERFRTTRRLTIYKDSKREHYITNTALHERLVNSCDRALQALASISE